MIHRQPMADPRAAVVGDLVLKWRADDDPRVNDTLVQKLEHDFYYIKRFSVWLDLLIVGRTIKTMLTGFGAR